LLRIAAATGVLSMISHGIDLLHELGTRKTSWKRRREERITLARGEVWLLRIAAATGVLSMPSPTASTYYTN
jgi:hypothetical protein